MTNPKSIEIRITLDGEHGKDKASECGYGATMVFEFSDSKRLMEAFRLSFPLLSLHATTTITSNNMKLKIGNVEVQKGHLPNKSIEQLERYNNTGN